MNKNDGGPAFPRSGFESHFDHVGKHDTASQDGMTLRDYFAAKAAAAVLGGLVAQGASTERDDARRIALGAYLLADAMLAERSNEG